MFYKVNSLLFRSVVFQILFTMNNVSSALANILSGGDLRSKGRSEEIVAKAVKDKAVFLETLDCLFLPDLIVQTRAADAIEKITCMKPEWLSDVKRKIILSLS